jgi:hypothetical protein
MNYIRNNTHYVVALLSILVMANTAFGQKDARLCGAPKRAGIPRFRIGGFDRGKDDVLLIQISLSKNDINQKSLTLLSEFLNERYCKEKEIIATFFDSYEAAKHFTLNSMLPSFNESLNRSWGGYYLNRTTKEEYISYTTAPGYLRTNPDKKVIRVDLNLQSMQ